MRGIGNTGSSGGFHIHSMEADWGLDWHIQPVTSTSSCPHVDQNHLHHAGAKTLHCSEPWWLPPSCTHHHHHKQKCFKRLVLAHLKTSLQPTLDPYQFAYGQNKSTEDAISTALHSTLSHFDNGNTDMSMLFIDFSSTFNTIIPSKLIPKLSNLSINTTLCNWILDFLTNRPQSVRSDHHTSSTLILKTGIPQGCVLSPFFSPSPPMTAHLHMVQTPLSSLQTTQRWLVSSATTMIWATGRRSST